MALKPLNSVGGFSVGETPNNVILSNGFFTGAGGNFAGNLSISNATASWGIITDNLYYSNGTAWDLQQAAGANNQVQFNSDNNFSASANFTFDPATSLLTVTGNSQFNNANLGNLAIANFVNVASNVVSNNLTVNLELQANTANFDGNVTMDKWLTVANTANVGNLRTDNLLYANGTPWDMQQPGGTNTQVQFNDDDSFGGSANFTFNKTTNALTLSGNLQTNNANLGNLATANYVNVANQVNGNVANFSGNLTALNANLGNLATANFVNVSTNVNVTGTMEAGNVRTDNLLHANGAAWDFQQPAGANTQIQYNDGNGGFGASANLVFNEATNLFYLNGSGNITGNLTVLGNIANANNVSITNALNGNTANFSGNLTSLNANLGNLATANYVNVANDLNGNVANFSGNLTSLNASLGNLATANFVNVASNIVTSNLTVNLELGGNTANFSGNVQVNNFDVNLELTGSTANFTGAVQVNSLSANGNVLSGNVNVNNATTTNSLTVNNAITGNTANFSGNVTMNNATVNLQLNGNTANFSGNVVAANLIGDLANGNSNVKVYSNSNVQISIGGVANIATFTGNSLLVVGNIQSTAGNMLANGNITANGFLIGANAQITGQANVGSVLTSNITAPTGNITISSAGTNENIILDPTGTGAVDVSGARIIQLGAPVDPTDAATKEYVDAIGGTGLTIHSPVRVEANTALTGTYAVGGTTQTTTDITGNKTITFSGNHGLSVNDGIVWTNSFNGIVGGEAYWVYSIPALNQITIKDGYFGAEVTTLTNGTGLSQASRANPGVGATLTNSGANAGLVIDGITVANTDRVLVYSQANSAHNGVYVVSDKGNATAAWVLTRSADMDKYIPASSSGMGKGDYVFVEQGASGAGESYVLTSPDGEIIIGTDSVLFTQFSSAGSYTAGNGINISGTQISANVDNETTAIVSGNIVVKSSANLTTPNIGDATFSSLTWNNLSNGNITANNLSIGNVANITGNLTVAANLQVSYNIDSNANIYSNNSDVTNFLTVGGNTTSNNITSNNWLNTASANVSANLITNNATVNLAFVGNTANFSGNVILPNLTVNLELVGNTANFSGNVRSNNLTVNNVFTGNTANFSGNVVLPNLTVNLELAGNTANFSGNIKAANANLGNLVTANYFTGTLANGTSNVAIPSVNGNINLTAAGNTTLVVTGTGANVAGTANVTGNINGGANLNLSSDLFANNITSNNVVTVGNTAVRWATVTTSAITGNQTIATLATSGITGYEFLVKGIDSTGGKYSIATVSAVTDGSTVDYSTYATAALGGTTGTLAVNVVGSNIALQVTPASSNSTVWTVQYRTI